MSTAEPGAEAPQENLSFPSHLSHLRRPTLWAVQRTSVDGYGKKKQSFKRLARQVLDRGDLDHHLWCYLDSYRH